jgi:hypothetical protein
MYNYEKLEELLNAIINKAEPVLPKENITDAREFVQNREYGVAFDLVCSQLGELEITIDQNLYSQIEEAGKHMQLKEDSWSFLAERVK